MKQFLFGLIFTFILYGCASGGWRVVDGGEFTIEFPGVPTDTVTAVGDDAGAKLYYQPVQGGIDSNVYYSVSVYTMSDSGSVMGDMLDDFMLKDAEIFAWSIDALLVDSGKVVKSNDYEGREYKIFLAENAGVVTMRKFVKGDHMYTLMVITGNFALDNSDIYYFLDSFKLK